MNPELCSAVPTFSSGFLGLEQDTAAYAAYTTDGFYVPPRREHVSQVDRTFRSTAVAHQRLAEGKQLDIGSDLAVEVKANADLEARLRTELDAARAHLAERTKAYHQLQTFARAKCDELQLVVEAAAREKAVLMRDQEALRRESTKLKQLVGDVVRRARAGFTQLRAKLDEARAAGGAAETTGEAAETGEAHLRGVVPHEQITPSPPAAATPQSLALVAVLTPRPTPALLEPAVIPKPDTDDLQYLSELRCTPVPPSASVDEEEGGAIVPADRDRLAASSGSSSTFYTWDPAQPRKRRRVEFDSSSTESESDSDGGALRRRRRRRTPNERSSSSISMGPAFPIPRELNFDVKTLTSPVHYFMEIRRRRLG